MRFQTISLRIAASFSVFPALANSDISQDIILESKFTVLVIEVGTQQMAGVALLKYI